MDGRERRRKRVGEEGKTNIAFYLMLLLLSHGKKVLLGIEDPTANPSQWLYSNTMYP
jgi:hypothetical protein